MEFQNLEKIHFKAKKQSLCVLFIIGLALFMVACAGFKKPATINQAPVYERALTEERNGIRVSTAVVGDREARQIFGIDLVRKSIQAVWIEIENNSEHSFILLPIAIDPEYFAPLEVAFFYHKSFATEANEALNEHLQSLNFPIRSTVLPGARMSGYIFTNREEGLKVIDIDLLGDNFSDNFTFFAPNPDSARGQEIYNHLKAKILQDDLQIEKSDAELREALEKLPCCVLTEDGKTLSEPLNVVIIGAIEDWTTAFVRRGYHYQVLNKRFAFGRDQDISGRKVNRNYTKSQSHTVRLWLTPIRYHDKPVWIGQTSVRKGGRFSDKAPVEVTLPLDPYVDEARYDLAQDLVYSQALVKIGFVKSSGKSHSTEAEKASGGIDYRTDGLRVVLVFGDRPASIEYYSLVAFTDRDRINKLLVRAYDMLKPIDPRNDGLLLFSDQVIPGAVLLGYANDDHWEVALPFEDNSSLLAKLISKKSSYPREILLHAIILFITENLNS